MPSKRTSSCSAFLLSLAWILALISIIAIALVNGAGTDVSTDVNTNSGSGWRGALGRFSILTLTFKGTEDIIGTAFAWYPNALVATVELGTTLYERIWTGPGSDITSTFSAAGLSLSFHWANNMIPFIFHAAAAALTLPSILLIPFLGCNAFSRSGRAVSISIAVCSTLSFACAVVGAALLTTKASRYRADLLEFGVMLDVSRLGVPFLIVLWVPTALLLTAALFTWVDVASRGGQPEDAERKGMKSEDMLLNGM